MDEIMYHIDNKDISDIQELQDKLEKKYGPSVAQDIIDRLGKIEGQPGAPADTDVKAMSELQQRYRAQAMTAVWRLKEWRRMELKGANETGLRQQEGLFLNNKCADAIKLYRNAHKAYCAMARAKTQAVNTNIVRIHEDLLQTV